MNTILQKKNIILNCQPKAKEDVIKEIGKIFYDDGYTTEKMTQPLSAGSVPIYWGNPTVTTDFNPEAFVNANGMEEKLNELVKRIIELDKDDEAYLKVIHAKPMQDSFDFDEMKHYEEFFVNIFRKGNTPYVKDPLLFAKRMSVDNLSRKEKIKYFLFK